MKSLANGMTFSCEMEMIIWLCRHQDEPLIRCWWIGFEWSQQGRTLERVIWEILHNPEIYQ